MFGMTSTFAGVRRQDLGHRDSPSLLSRNGSKISTTIGEYAIPRSFRSPKRQSEAGMAHSTYFEGTSPHFPAIVRPFDPIASKKDLGNTLSPALSACKPRKDLRMARLS